MVAKHSESVWIYLAYTFITLSYLNVNILFIRLFLIFASIFFICFACLVGNVFVDSLVFNSVFIIINGTYSYFLLLRYLPIKLSPLEERIYEKDFKRVMDRRTFRDLIRKAYLRSFSEGGQITHHGNNFSGLFYVAMINPKFKVTYIKKGKEYFEIKENSWIGVVEYMMYEKEKRKLISVPVTNTKIAQLPDKELKEIKKIKKNIKVKWGLDAVVKETGDLNEVLDPIYEEDDDPCYVYEFPLSILEKLFVDKDEGVVWKNALFSMWLGYTTQAIIGVDDKLRYQLQKKKSILKDQEEYTQTERGNTNRINTDKFTVPNEEDELNYEKNIQSNRALLSPSNLTRKNPVNPEHVNIDINYRKSN